jgi:hypothetical protein
MLPLIYVASPFMGIKTANPKLDDKAVEDIALKIAHRAIAQIPKNDLTKVYIPFSPVLAFSQVCDETQRLGIMKVCLAIVEQSALFVWTECKYTAYSSGMHAERLRAKSLYIPIITIELTLFEPFLSA